MIHNILFSLWFFLPAGVANVTPIIVAQLPGFRNLNAPLDNGKYFRKKRIFGEHKTWRGIVCGIIVGVLLVWLQGVIFRNEAWFRNISAPLSYDSISILVLGILLSFGALFGDVLESFFKRQHNIDSGDSWFPFDQLDYVIGGLLLSIIYVRLPVIDYFWIIIIWFGMHMLFSFFGYLIKLKEKPI
jgi:CDP-2,3-bis-(O-geranylgeranyl)-sn-glycerol synthase